MTDVLAGFARFDFTHGGITHPVFRGGSGPAIVIIHEIPGLHPGVVTFARTVISQGFSVYLPSMFGTPGAPVTKPAIYSALARACVAREFTLFALGRTSPAVGWLRALGAMAHERCGRPGIGAVGMCLTGGFALGMMVDDRMLAPVLSQPSLPVAITDSRRAALGVSDDDLATVKRRAAAGACLLGLRFTGDRASPGERFAALRRELGEAFIGVEIDSSPGNPYGIEVSSHSVLTEHFVDEPGHPTRDALETVLAFFVDRLRGSGR